MSLIQTMFQDSQAINREWTPPSVQRSNYTAILHADFVYASIAKLVAPGCIRAVGIIPQVCSLPRVKRDW